MKLPQKVVKCHGGNNYYVYLLIFLSIILPVIVINIKLIVQKGAFLFLPSNVEVYQNKSTTTSTKTTTTTNWHQREETLRFDDSLLSTVPTHNNLTTTTVPTSTTSTPTTLSSTTTLSPTDVDTDAITLCTRAQIRNGTWTGTVLEGGAPYQPTSRWHRTCETRGWNKTKNAKFNYSSPWHTFKWEPVDAATGKCSFSEWKASDFCELFAFAGSTSTNDGGDDDEGGGNRTERGGTTPRPVTIAFLGDSTTFQQFSSLSMLLGEHIQGKEQQVSIKKKIDIVRKPCGGNVTLSYRRDDTLHRLPTVIAEMQPDVIVLNTGIHHHLDPIFKKIMKQTLKELQGWQTSCQQKNQNNNGRSGRFRICLPILRTTMPGHPFCMNYTTPSESLQDMEQLIYTQSNYNQFVGGKKKYYWWDVKRQNQQFLLDAFATTKLSPYDIIDGYDINVLRPDRHQHEGDCLHYCLPGPPDVLNQILLHILRRQRRAFAV